MFQTDAIIWHGIVNKKQQKEAVIYPFKSILTAILVVSNPVADERKEKDSIKHNMLTWYSANLVKIECLSEIT